MAWKVFIFVIKQTGEKIFSYYHEQDGEDGHRLLPCPNHPDEKIICPECHAKFNAKKAETSELAAEDYWLHLPLYGKYLYDFYLSFDFHIHADGSKHECYKNARLIYCKDCDAVLDPHNDYAKKAILWGKAELPVMGEIKYYLFKGATIWFSYEENGNKRFGFLDPNTEVLGEAMPYRDGLLYCPDRDIEQAKNDFFFELQDALPSPTIFAEVNAFKSKIDKKLGNDKTKTLPIDMQAIVMGELGHFVKEPNEIEAELPSPEERIPKKPRNFRSGKTRELPSGSNELPKDPTVVMPAQPLETGEYEIFPIGQEASGEEMFQVTNEETTPLPEGSPLPILPGESTSAEQEIPRIETLELPSLPLDEEKPDTNPDAEEAEENDEGGYSGDFVSEETANIDPSDFTPFSTEEEAAAFEDGLRKLERDLTEADTVDDTEFAKNVITILQAKLENMLLQLELRGRELKSDLLGDKISFQKVLETFARVKIPEEQIQIILDWSKRLLALEERYEAKLAAADSILQDKSSELENKRQNQERQFISSLRHRIQEISLLWTEMLKTLHEEMEEAQAQQIKEHQAALEKIRVAAEADKAAAKAAEEERLQAEEDAFRQKLADLEKQIDWMQGSIASWSTTHLAETKTTVEEVISSELTSAQEALQKSATEASNSQIKSQKAFKMHIDSQLAEMAQQHGENLAAYDERLEQTAEKLNKAAKARWKIALPILLGIFFFGALTVLIYSSVVSHDQAQKNAQQRAQLDKEYRAKIALLEKELEDKKALAGQLENQQKIQAKLQRKSHKLDKNLKNSLDKLEKLRQFETNRQNDFSRFSEELRLLRDYYNILLQQKVSDDWLREKENRQEDFTDLSEELRLLRDYYNTLLQRKTANSELSYWSYLLVNLQKPDDNKEGQKLKLFETELKGFKQSLKKLRQESLEPQSCEDPTKQTNLQKNMEAQLRKLRQSKLKLQIFQPGTSQKVLTPPKTSVPPQQQLKWRSKRDYQKNPISIRIINSRGRVLKKLQ